MAFVSGSITARLNLDPSPFRRQVRATIQEAKVFGKSLIESINKGTGRRALLNSTIRLTVKALKLLGLTATRTFAKVTRGFVTLAKAPLKLLATMSTLTNAFRAFIVAAGLRELVSRSQDVETLGIAFESLTRSVGGTSRVMLGELRKATLGTVSDLELMRTTNNAVLLGVVQSTEQFAELARVARRLGRAVGRDTTDSINDLAIGIGRQSRLILDNLGIIVRAEDAYKRFAEANGKLVAELTDTEKRVAFTAAAMAAARERVDALGDDVETQTDKWQRLKAELANILNEFAGTVIDASLPETLLDILDQARGYILGFARFIRIIVPETVKAVTEFLKSQDGPVEVIAGILFTLAHDVIPAFLETIVLLFSAFWASIQGQIAGDALASVRRAGESIGASVFEGISDGAQQGFAFLTSSIMGAAEQIGFVEEGAQARHDELMQRSIGDDRSALLKLNKSLEVAREAEARRAGEPARKRLKKFAEGVGDDLTSTLAAAVKKLSRSGPFGQGLVKIFDRLTDTLFKASRVFKSSIKKGGPFDLKPITKDVDDVFKITAGSLDTLLAALRTATEEGKDTVLVPGLGEQNLDDALQALKDLRDELLGMNKAYVDLNKEVGSFVLNEKEVRDVLGKLSAAETRLTAQIADFGKTGLEATLAKAARAIETLRAKGAAPGKILLPKDADTLARFEKELDDLGRTLTRLEGAKAGLATLEGLRQEVTEIEEAVRRFDLTEDQLQLLEFADALEKLSEAGATGRQNREGRLEYEKLGKSLKALQLKVIAGEADELKIALANIGKTGVALEIDAIDRAMERANVEFREAPEHLKKVIAALEGLKALNVAKFLKEDAAAGREFSESLATSGFAARGGRADQVALREFDASRKKKRREIEGVEGATGAIARFDFDAETGRQREELIRDSNKTILHGFSKDMSTSVLTGLVDGFTKGQKFSEIFADITSQLFEENMTKTIDRVTDYLSDAFAGAFESIIGKEGAGGLIAGIGSGLIALGAGILQGLSNDTSSTIDDFESQVNSSEAVRGVVAGPTNIAISKVGDSLKNALTTTELLLERIALGVERNSGGGGAGGDSFQFATGSTS